MQQEENGGEGREEEEFICAYPLSLSPSLWPSPRLWASASAQRGRTERSEKRCLLIRVYICLHILITVIFARPLVRSLAHLWRAITEDRKEVEKNGRKEIEIPP